MLLVIVKTTSNIAQNSKNGTLSGKVVRGIMLRNYIKDGRLIYFFILVVFIIIISCISVIKGDVRVEFDSINVLTPQFYNTTSQPVQLGGWRFFTTTFHWMNVPITGALLNQRERMVNGYIETEAAFDKSVDESITKLMYTGNNPTSQNVAYSWVTNSEFPMVNDPYEPYTMIKTGS